MEHTSSLPFKKGSNLGNKFTLIKKKGIPIRFVEINKVLSKKADSKKNN